MDIDPLALGEGPVICEESPDGHIRSVVTQRNVTKRQCDDAARWVHLVNQARRGERRAIARAEAAEAVLEPAEVPA